MLRRSAELFPNSAPFVPVPRDLLCEQQALNIAPNDLAVLLAIIGHGYARTDWPVFPMTWASLQRATGRGRAALRRAVRALEDAGVIETSHPTPASPLHFDLFKLQLRLAAMHDARSALAMIRRRQPQEPRQLALPGLELLENPPDHLVAEATLRLQQARAPRRTGGRLYQPKAVSG